MVKYHRIKVYTARLIELIFYVASFFLLKKSEDQFSREGHKKILVIEPFGLGDLILMTSMIPPLKDKYPGCKIGVVCRSQWKDFPENHPGIDIVHHFDFFWSRKNKSLNIKEFCELGSFCGALRKEKYDIGFDIRGDIRSAVLLVMANCTERYGYSDYLGSNITTRGALLTRAVACGNKSRIEELSSLLDCAGIYNQRPLKINLGLCLPSKRDRDFTKIGIHIGAGWKYREWKAEKWLEVIKRLRESGKHEIVLIGNSEEQRKLSEINLATGMACRQLETKDFNAFIFSIADLDLLICLDSAAGHIATGCNVPSVKLFGPGVVERWGNLGGKEYVSHHQKEYPCAPCTQLNCVHPDSNCMDLISAEEVALAAIQMLNSAPMDY